MAKVPCGAGATGVGVATSGVSGGMPLGDWAAAADDGGLPVRSVRAGDVGAAFSVGGVLYDVREYAWDGTLAYRVAGFPLTAQRLVLLGLDKLRRPENRLYAGGSLNGSTWEARHELGLVIYLLHLPFVLFAMWLGAGLWWVARRLFGNEGAFLSLGLYCFCPEVVRYAVRPNNEVLAMWGLYGLVYTAIGVAHAMHGPVKKWRPRIVLLSVALGLTAAAHLVAAMVGFVAAGWC